MSNHNKKRNVGLVYEFFARYIGLAVINNNNDDIAKAKKILKKHFGVGTELNKELKMFKALYESSVTSREAAVHLANRVREMASKQDKRALDSEKSSLILEINGSLNDPDFFNRPVSDYKTYASIQVLLNAWRDEKVLTESLTESLAIEEKVIEHLCGKSRGEKSPGVLQMQMSDVDKMVVNIMTEKVNKRFAGELNDEQKAIIQLYVFKDTSKDYSDKLNEALLGLQGRVKSVLLKSKKEFEKDKAVSKKLDEVFALLEGSYADVSKPNDDLVTFYLSLPKLESELLDVK
jgi:hypothetical protein